MKITKATLKKFVRENEGKLFIKIHSSFNMQDDSLSFYKSTFVKVENTENFLENTLGIKGFWLVKDKNWFSEVVEEEYKGIHVSNYCGSFSIAVKI